ncbi:gamma-glutamylcyclotransferase family protein [Streptomyces sp. NPDC005805]|uniref:gamma-glutamylcyclotransferase family protein n=1 Tax=Streptomyces sp. NPDC005805 TaxID=3157068 RepID=UPI0033FDDDD0
MTGPLPFFVYGTLRPGGPNHALFLAGRTVAEEPALLPGALLYDGPGYPYAVDDASGAGRVAGEVVTARPGEYARLLAELDRLEEYLAPGDPRNLYERVVREVVRPGGGSPLHAWVYVAGAEVARGLLTGGALVPDGDWARRRTADPA